MFTFLEFKSNIHVKYVTTRYVRHEVKQTVTEYIWENDDEEENLIGMSDSIMTLRKDVMKLFDYISMCFYVHSKETNI